MCFLVEVPPHERYKFKNVICAGLWYGKMKPVVSLFLESFVNELSMLGNGCNFEDDSENMIPSLVRIQSLVPDLPAKAMLLNLKQFNGKFGCSTCKHPGTYVRELGARIYEYKPNVPLRTVEESHRLANVAEATGSDIYGIKGKNVFGRLVSIPENVPIDWMHCVCEGILKRQLFQKWFSEGYASQDFNLLHFIDEFDSMYTSIKVPHDVNRKPRSLRDIKHWKASEFRLFVLFIGLPCLRQAVLSDVFPAETFYHFALLVTALRFLHSMSVSNHSVETSQILLDNFVRLLPHLYGGRDSTYNSHALLHLPGQIIDNGPLAFTSAFVFEFFIAHLNNIFSGTRGIPKQMITKLGISQNYLAHVMNNSQDNHRVEQLSKHFLKEPQNLRKAEGGIFLYEPITVRKMPEFHTLLNAEFGATAGTELNVSFRMKKENVIYHSTMYSRRGNSASYIIQWQASANYRRHKYGKVACYLLHGNVAYAIVLNLRLTGVTVCQELLPPEDPVLRGIVDRNLIGQQFLEVEETDIAVLINCSVIENRCIFLKTRDEKGFVTALDTTYEHD